jgi:hypothetical protein
VLLTRDIIGINREEQVKLARPRWDCRNFQGEAEPEILVLLK